MSVTGPLNRPVRARYLVQHGRVVVETAEACGLHLVPTGLRDPLRTTSWGVGELLRAATAALPGPDAQLVVGLGGSATVDAGAGMAYSLGWRLLDDEDAPILPCGSGLRRLHRIEPPPLPLLAAPPLVLADVTNPLLGPRGAAAVYAPQKGASPRDVSVLELGLAQWAAVVRRDVGVDVADRPGSGAAGGLGAAFAALLDAPVRSGTDWVLDTLDFDGLLAGARAVVTGEGSWDEQSSMGKVTGEVVSRARARGIPTLVVAGSFRSPLPEGVAGAGGDGPGRPAAADQEAPGATPDVPGPELLDAAALAQHAREGLAGLLGSRRRP